MEAEVKNLLSASWSPRKVGGIVPVQTLRPETQGSPQCKAQLESKGLRTRSTDAGMQEKTAVQLKQKTDSPLLGRLFSIQALNRLDDAQLLWGMFTQSSHSDVSLRNTITGTPENNVSSTISASQSSRRIKLAITACCGMLFIPEGFVIGALTSPFFPRGE